MKVPALFLALLLAVPAACGRSGDPATGARTDSAGAALPGNPAAAIAAAERASAAGEPDTAPAGAVRADSAEGNRPAGPAAAGGGGGAASPAPAADSAGRILARAAARYAAVRSLQADFSMSYENPLLRSRTNGAGTLYQKRPDRLLLRFSEPAGDVILSDGRYFWVYYPSVDATQVLRSPASAGTNSGVDLQAQFLGDPTRRFAYTLDGEEAVGGRNAWRLTLKPHQQQGYRQLRVWIDQREYLARRFEITEDNGSVRRFELRNVRLDTGLSDALFQFDVPAGARVITR